MCEIITFLQPCNDMWQQIDIARRQFMHTTLQSPFPGLRHQLRKSSSRAILAPPNVDVQNNFDGVTSRLTGVFRCCASTAAAAVAAIDVLHSFFTPHWLQANDSSQRLHSAFCRSWYSCWSHANYLNNLLSNIDTAESYTLLITGRRERLTDVGGNNIGQHQRRRHARSRCNWRHEMDSSIRTSLWRFCNNAVSIDCSACTVVIKIQWI